jgi:plasmid stabilization system protein ParE
VADLREAQAWYEGQTPAWGASSFSASQTRRFPYKPFYRIEGDAVIVFRILHAARDHTRQLE